jgi:hypothetical protein
MLMPEKMRYASCVMRHASYGKTWIESPEIECAFSQMKPQHGTTLRASQHVFLTTTTI